MPCEIFEKTYFVEHIRAESWLKLTKKKLCLMYSQENTSEDILFSAVPDMLAYSFSTRTTSQMLFYKNCMKFYRKSFFQNTAVRLLLIFCNIFNKTQKASSMVIFGGWDWLGKQKDVLQKQPPGHVLQRRCSRIFGNFFSKTPVQEPCFKKKFQAVGLQLYFKRGLCIGFLSAKCLKLFRTNFL